MFRALLCPSSGPHDYFADYHMDRPVLGLLLVGSQVQAGWISVRAAGYGPCGNQHNIRELLMMGITVPETFSAYHKYNKTISSFQLALILQLSQRCIFQYTSNLCPVLLLLLFLFLFVVVRYGTKYCTQVATDLVCTDSYDITAYISIMLLFVLMRFQFNVISELLRYFAYVRSISHGIPLQTYAPTAPTSHNKRF